jgi:hypothetical protein
MEVPPAEEQPAQAEDAPSVEITMEYNGPAKWVIICSPVSGKGKTRHLNNSH